MQPHHQPQTRHADDRERFLDKSKVNAISRHRASNGKAKNHRKCLSIIITSRSASYTLVRNTNGRATRKGTEKKLSSKQIDRQQSKNVVKSKGIVVMRVDLTKKRKYVTIGAMVHQHQWCSSKFVARFRFRHYHHLEMYMDIGGKACHRFNTRRSSSGNSTDIVGEFKAKITIQEVTKASRLFVTNNPELNVLGIGTIDEFDLWSVPFSSLVSSIKQYPNAMMQQLQVKFLEVFQSTRGCCTRAKLTFYPKPHVRPVYCLKRSVAYAALP